MADIIIGRQQIFDQKLNIYAYELLFRGNDFDLNHSDGATQATNQVITDTILELGLNAIVGPHKAFINFTTQNILDKTPLHLPKDRIVIEVLENVEIDSRVVANLKELSTLGYIIALDDFVFSEEWTPLVEFADIIKLDILEMGESKTRALINQLKPYNVQLLAEKVETYSEYQYLVELGCDYFQGFFFNKPNIVSGKRVSVNQTAAIQLLNTVNNPDVEFEDLTKIISLDVGLSYKLLHYINSAFFSLPNKVSSINHAISYLGLKEIKRWINILTLASLSNKPEAVMQNALIRGKMCEELAALSDNKSDNFFLIGILSNLDSLLDMPLDEALSQLPLADDIVAAILHKKGLGGEALKCVISYEHWDISSIAFKDIDQSIIGDAYIRSINWAKDVMGNIN
ncbi:MULTISPECIES: EAL and HDOD domain-containing protein [Methylobacter]|uniref:Diguanylate phosphodiesterase n=2 Tax=Methylobacter tundripaludum TaxID=173365 RepID=G3IWL3_METTV|nr:MULTISPECIES: HDOD domain-containing protein [Methylobacter]EGW21952.1 diguanylate phosphodiesterase [Methylobacter tundripaludum SV96]MDI1276841.1 HDOD domain-containing protein [Methylobacter sp.]MDI1357507.1 HDOD domain-containing protein [Methylobacter sp.]PPK76645.1 EAL and modified HD-GYP domain-containing signal transduction protein [Methylobacter tundripaludum]